MAASGPEIARCALPDTIIGLGNAGKQVVFHYMETDWILREGLEPREDESNPDFDGFVLDTATDEQAEDEGRAAAINDHIRTLCTEEFDRRVANVGTRLRYVNPLDGTNPRYTSRVGLTSDNTVQRIARSSSLKAWWLSSNEHMLVDGYDEGVVRRRGLSKALYHASQTGENPLGDLLTQATGSVAMVVGLGGGTGSGMFLDIAKLLASAEGNAGSLTLYAIIPGTDEVTRKKANAHAALSELEYLSLTNQNPFSNIVLLPYGPARGLEDTGEFYEGVAQTIVARENTAPNLSDFLDANSPDGPPRYAPFTVAYPQINRYAVEDTKTVADELEQFVESKRASLDEELALYDELEAFVFDYLADQPVAEHLRRALDRTNPDDPRFSLDSDEAHELGTRLTALERFLKAEQFTYLEYNAPERWRENLDEQRRQVLRGVGESDELSETERTELLVTEVPWIVGSLEDVEDVAAYESERDRELARVVRDELRAINRRANLLRAVHAIEDPLVQEGFLAALDTEMGAHVGSSNLRERTNDLHEQIRAARDNAGVLGEFLTDDAVDDRVETHLAEWRSAVRADLETLVHIDENADRLGTLLDDLETEIQRAVREINDATHPDDLSTDPLTFSSFEELDDLLAESGLEPVDGERLAASLSAAAKARREWLRSRNVSFLRRLVTNAYGEHRRLYGQHADSVDRDLFSVAPAGEEDFDGPFSIEFVDDSLDRRMAAVDEERADRLSAVAETFERFRREPPVDQDAFEEFVADRWEGTLPHVSWPGDPDEEDSAERLRARLDRDLSGESAESLATELCARGRDFEARLVADLGEETAGELPARLIDARGRTRESGVVAGALTAAALGPAADLLRELDADLTSLRAEREKYDDLVTIIREAGLAEIRETGQDAIGGDIDIATDREYTYVPQVSAEGSDPLRQYDDIEDAGLWEREGGEREDDERERDERETMEVALTTFAERAASLDSHTGIDHGTLEIASSGDGGTRYEGHYVLAVTMGRPLPPDEEDPGGRVFEEMENLFRDRIHLDSGQDGYAAKAVGFGGPWDLSLTTFVGGVFLDNLGLLTSEESGYLSAYERQHGQLFEDIRIRHVHGVDGRDATLNGDADGGFVYRAETMDLLDDSPGGDLDRFVSDADSESAVREWLLDEEFIATEQFESTIDLDLPDERG